jgi:hypothetical protein
MRIPRTVLLLAGPVAVLGAVVARHVVRRARGAVPQPVPVSDPDMDLDTTRYQRAAPSVHVDQFP